MNKTSIEFPAQLYCICPGTFKTWRIYAILAASSLCDSAASMAERQCSQTVAAWSLCTWWNDIEEIFEVIHPHFGQAPVVLVDDLARSSGEAVWGRLPENMAHVWARYDFQRAAALPDLQLHEDKLLLYRMWQEGTNK